MSLKSYLAFLGVLKLLEILIGLTCIALLRRFYLSFGEVDQQFIGVIAIGHSILFTLPLFICVVFLKHEPGVLEAMMCASASVMNVIGGAFAINLYLDSQNYENGRAGAAMGTLMVINALVYVVDAASSYFIDK